MLLPLLKIRKGEIIDILLRCTKEKRCASDGRIHKNLNECQKVIRCYNCNKTDHKSGSHECETFKRELEFCNRKYVKMLELKPLKKTKYNIRSNGHELAQISKTNSVCSLTSAASASSSNRFGNETILNMIHNLENGQKELSERMNSVETKVVEVQNQVNGIQKVVEETIDTHLSTIRQDNAALINDAIKAFIDAQTKK